MKKSTIQERRRYNRMPTNIQTVVIHESKGEICSESKDMSLGGIFLKTNIPYQEGTELTLRLTLPEYRKPIEVRGKVTNVLAQNGVGIEFVDLDPDRERAIRHHLLFVAKK